MSDDCRVLLYDDNQNVLHLLKYSLEEQGMHVDCASSDADVLHMGADGHYDVIVMREHAADTGLMLRDIGCTTPFVMISKGRLSIEQLTDAIRGVVRFVVA